MPRLGRTGDFPRGKLSAADEGELRVAIGVSDKTVIIDFGTQVVWVGLDKNEALELAAIIRKHAESL